MNKTLAALLALVLARSALAAVAVDATSHATALALDANTDTVGILWNHTVGGSATKLVVTCGIGASISTDRVITSATANGNALTKITSADDGNFLRSEIWKIDSPPTGVVALVVKTQTGANVDIGCGAISFTGTSSTDGTPATATNTSANPTVNATTVSGDIVVDAYCSDLGSTNTSTESGTLIWEDEDIAADIDVGSQRKTASTTTTTMNWTAASDVWVLAAVAIKASGGGSTKSAIIIQELSH